MKVSTEEFISLIEERPALWQKSHPDFNNRDIRYQLLTELSLETDVEPEECAKKLKSLKDAMRSQVAKLPKTSSGTPSFSKIDHVLWPYFKPLLFMKDEFTGKKVKRTSYFTSAGSSASSLSTSNQGWDSQDGAMSVSVVNPKKRSRPRSISNQSDDYDYDNNYEYGDDNNMTSSVIEQAPPTDELDVFASDMANDLRKINCPLKLMQAKSKIRRITEEFVMSELVPLTPVHNADVSSMDNP